MRKMMEGTLIPLPFLLLFASCGDLVTIQVEGDIVLTETAIEALQVAPAFVRPELRDLLVRLEEDTQDELGLLLLDLADPRLADEVAFSIAHLSPEVIEDRDFMPEILEENAYYLYWIDEYIDYADLTEYGGSGDEDFYTTLTYRVEEEGEEMEIELDRDIYYWYVVHPKIEDESPYYIDPDRANSRVKEPPEGRFWREFLINYADEEYPFLRNYMEGESFLWKGKAYEKEDNGAIGRVIGWMQESMAFGAGSERPIQPVRIYALHKGNCGEWADMTTAAARTVLIPCRNVGARGNDHTWNEFYDRRWVQWEPVNTYVEHYYYYVDEDGQYYFQMDGKDNDCDGVADFGDDESDSDADGFSEVDGDCNDTNPEIYPGAEEALDDGIDNDCDGMADDGISIADEDGDGWSIRDGDCNDVDGNIHPGAEDPPPSNNRVYSVTAWRGDDYMWDVTESYGNPFTLEVLVRDDEGAPVDAAVVTLYGPILVYPEYSDYFWFVSGGVTDINGYSSFVLGEANDYYGRVDSDIGAYPEDEDSIRNILSWAEPGVVETWEVELDGEVPHLDAIYEESLSSKEMKLSVDYDFATYYLHGKNPLFLSYGMDDSTFSLEGTGGSIEVLALSEANYERYQGGEDFYAFYQKGDVSKGVADIFIPSGETSYLLFSNHTSLSTSRYGTVSIQAFRGCNDRGEGCSEDTYFTHETVLPEGGGLVLKVQVKD